MLFRSEDKGKGNANNGGKNHNGNGNNGNNNNGNNNHNGNNGNSSKRQHEGGSDLVANTNIGYNKFQRREDNYRGNNNNRNYRGIFRGPANPQEAFNMPCPRHSRNGKPANHSLSQCVDLQRWKNEEFARMSMGGNGPRPGNVNNPAHGPQAGGNNEKIGRASCRERVYVLV